MNDNLHISNNGIKLIHSFEGCKLKAYHDAVGVLTIGWGHTNATIPNFSPIAKWTQDYADEVFRSDIIKYEDAVKRNVKTELTQEQFDSLVSLVYNIGEGNFKKSSLLRKLNNNDYVGACSEFSKWNRAGGNVLPGLTRRRAAEALMFQSTSLSVSPHDSEAPVQQVDTPVTANPLNSKIVQIGGAAAATGATTAVTSITDKTDTVGNAAEIVEKTKDTGIWEHIWNLPSLFWMGMGVIVCAGLIIYFRIKDHS